MPAKSAKQIAWLAGILEGEGYFMAADRTSRSKVMIAVRMTDKDIIQRVARIWDCFVQIKERSNLKWKTAYCAEIHGKKAIQWAMTVYCLMGERRQSRIREMITLWRKETVYVRKVS